MAERRPARASVRARTTAVSLLVVAVALLAGAAALVLLVRDSLRDGIEAAAGQRAAGLAAQIEAGVLPTGTGDDDDPDDVVWQVLDATGAVVRSSQPLGTTLPAGGETALPGTDHRYVVAGESAGGYEVRAAASLEEVGDATEALAGPLLAGLPLVLLLTGVTTWVTAGRALAPVEAIRREVESITGDRLDRRVPEPPARDEINRLARTMNRMLDRLESARARQQQFVGDASHELRSPLAAIRQVAEVAHAHPGAIPPERVTEAVLAESGRMQRLVEQLLQLTRADGAVVAPRQDVDLDDIALAEARRAGPVVDTSGIGAGRVRGDRTALAQVARNLVDNAVRHAAGRVAVAVRTAGDRVELTVEDDGAGVPPAERERIFERFVRLDEARARDAGGSGLGLAIVREIVTAHGGTVAVDSGALGGARFTVRLPA